MCTRQPGKDFFEESSFQEPPRNRYPPNKKTCLINHSNRKQAQRPLDKLGDRQQQTTTLEGILQLNHTLEPPPNRSSCNKIPQTTYRCMTILAVDHPPKFLGFLIAFSRSGSVDPHLQWENWNSGNSRGCYKPRLPQLILINESDLSVVWIKICVF